METDIERAVFVSKDGRRARAIRRGSRVAIGLTVLWLGALVAGAVGPGQLSLGPLPWPSPATEPVRRHEPRPDAMRPPPADRERSARARAPAPAPVASRFVPSSRAGPADTDEPRRSNTRASTGRPAPQAPASVTRVKDTTTGTRDAQPSEPAATSERQDAPKPDAVVVSASQLAPAGTTSHATGAPTYAPSQTAGAQAGTTSGSPAPPPDPTDPGAAESPGGS